MMDKLILVFLCLLPFSAIFLNKIDIWHGQGYFAQSSILIIYCLHLFKKNKPLAVLLGWVGMQTIIQFASIQVTTSQYPAMLFFPFFNFLCVVILFDLLTTYMKKDFYAKFIKWFCIPFGLVLIYCVLQRLGFDQFYHSVDKTIPHNNNEIVGIMGNTMHNAHFIAIGLPVLFILKGWKRKVSILFALSCIILTHSTSGLIIALATLIFGQIFLKIFNRWEIGITALLTILLVIIKLPYLKGLLNPEGRLEIWKGYYPILQAKGIIGWGLGSCNEIAKTPKFLDWKHLHFEYYQAAFEIGLIGLSIVFWGIIDYWRRFKSSAKDSTTVIMASVFLAFLLSAIVGYPAHLWVLSTLGIVSYSYLYKKELANV